MKVLGLDLSLTSSGYILLENNRVFANYLIKSKPLGKTPKDELIRLMRIRDQIILTSDIDLIVIEGIAFGIQKTTSLSQLSALNYMVRERCHLNKIPFVVVAPTTLKKFVCEKGNAKKEQMILSVYKRWKFSSENSDICDAYGLAKIGTTLLAKDKKITKRQEEVVKLLKEQIK